MKNSGPSLIRLQHRLSDTPNAFWHKNSQQGQWPLPALVHDLLWHHGLDVGFSDLDPFRGKRAHHPWYSVSQLIAWLMMDSAFEKHVTDKALALRTLTATAEVLNASGRLVYYVEDIDRREEFIRVVLDSLELRPEGETIEQAQDRLTSISSAERLALVTVNKARFPVPTKPGRGSHHARYGTTDGLSAMYNVS